MTEYQDRQEFELGHWAEVGWEAGKHVGQAHEQRPGHPVTLGWLTK